MTDNEIMTFEQAMFILRHGSCESDHKYLEAVLVIQEKIQFQKAEIHRLNVELVGMRGACESYKMHYDNAQAEIKMLKADKEALINGQETLQKNLPKVIRAEAIKEFAERSKEKFSELEYRTKTKRKTVSVNYLDSEMNWVLHDVSNQVIDNLVKEMIGETK